MLTQYIVWLKSLPPNFQLSISSGIVAVFLLATVFFSAVIVFLWNAFVLILVSLFKWEWLKTLEIDQKSIRKSCERLFGTFVVLSLAFAANHPGVYGVAIFIIATLITKPDFLLDLARIFRGRELPKNSEKALEQQQRDPSPASREEELMSDLKKTKDEKNVAELKHNFAQAYISIFGSQIRLLEILEKQPGGLTRVLLEALYRREEVSKIYPFTNYINYLMNYGLIDYIPDIDTYKMNDIGKLFLRYIEQQGYSKDKPN